jgi:Holliday junction resolvase
MKKNLYIFSSKGYKPDLYINIIGSCFHNFGHQNIEDIYILKIDDNSPAGDVKQGGLSTDESLIEQLKVIRRNIELHLKHLSNSEYLPWNKESNKFENIGLPKKIEIDEKFKYLYEQIYQKIISDEIRLKVINEKDLENTLNRIINNPSYEFIFDLTGIQKKDFISISLILLSKGSSIYIFETYRWFSLDENDLIHNLLRIKDKGQKEKSFEHHHLNPKGYVVVRSIGEDHINEMKKKWRDLIAENKREKVIFEIKNHLDKVTSLDSSLQSELVNASSRFYDAKYRLNQNVISKSEYDLEINRLTSLLLDIIFRID